MIVRDIMTTKLITIAPDATLAHAVNLLRQHGFHHLPVVRSMHVEVEKMKVRKTVLEGMLTAQDIDLQAALARQRDTNATSQRPWLERRVVEVMHRAPLRVSPMTSVPAAAQILVERNLNYLPVVEYEIIQNENKAVLVGLVTRSDLLLALSRAMGAFEPGMQLDIVLPLGDMAPLARALLLAAEMNMQIRSVMAAPSIGGVPNVAIIRLGTINPAPFLLRLQQERIHYAFGTPVEEGELHP